MQQTGQELTAALLQEDGTLGVILRDAPALEALLDALCGVTGPKEQDSEARAALAESIELLVSAQARCGMLPSPVTWLHVQPRCRGGATGPGLALAGYMKSAVCHCDHVSFSTPAAKAQWPWVKGCVMLSQGICSFPRVQSLLERCMQTCRMQACLTMLMDAVPCRWQQMRAAKSCGTLRLQKC